MVKIYIEGNASLREGFSILLSKLAGTVEFRIKMGDGVTETIRAFKHHQNKDGDKLLLIDLDKPDHRRNERLTEYGLEADSHSVFFMIQAMEAWFLSQQQMLNEYYGKTLRHADGHAKDIENPKQTLKNITNSLKNKYGKVSDAVELLKKLDAGKLTADFEDAAKLRRTLNF